MRMKNIIASPYTRIFWNEFLIDPDAEDYNMVTDQCVMGELSVPRLKKALSLFSENYVLMHHCLEEIDGTLFWKKSPLPQLQILPENADLQAFVREPFDLTKGPLARFGLKKKGTHEYEFITVFHHVIIDGLSAGEYYDALSSYYNCGNPLQALPGLKEIKQHFLLNQQQVDALDNEFDSKSFWERELEDIPPVNELPYLPRKIEHQELVGEVRFSVNFSLWADLKKNIKRVNNFLIFKTLWAVLISRVCQQKSVSIIYPIGIKGGEGLCMGAQINTAVFPLRIDENSCFNQLYQQALTHTLSQKIDGKLRHTQWPIYQVLSQSNIKPNVSFTQAFLKDYVFKFDGCQSKFNHRFNIDLAGSELIMEYQQKEQCFEFRIRYRRDLFDDTQMAELAQQYQQLMSDLLQHPERPLSEVPYLSSEQYARTIVEWNQTQVERHDEELTLTSLIAKQVALYPNNLALIDNHHQLTYAQLAQQSDRLACFLRSEFQRVTGQPLLTDTPIPVFLSRGVAATVAIIAVMKAGAAYVPIDPDAPQQRVSTILADLASPIALTESQLQASLKHCNDRLACVLIDDIPAEFSSSVLDLPKNRPVDLAYIIYTSGTTGRPKGTQLAHQGAANMVLAHAQAMMLDNTEQAKCLQFASLFFDAHVLETFTALCTGNQLYIASEVQRHDVSALLEALSDWHITHAFLPPALLKLKPQLPACVRTVASGGEACSQESMDYYRDQGRTVLNFYGPTEASVSVSYNRYEYNGAKNIGHPIDNIKFYVLDENLLPVPIGVKGQLFISGIGLARGYLHQPEMTHDRFIDNPFSQAEHYRRIYKTGDVVRWLADGKIEYVGRNDFQVKIRGFRIELEEIESQISSFAGVAQALVIVRGAENPRILAYFITEPQITDSNIADPLVAEKPTDTSIYQHLLGCLPDYMMPFGIMEIESIPVSLSGKVNQQALPEPKAISHYQEYRAPTSLLEQQLQDIWFTVLGSALSIDDDFFRCGGNSIMAIQLCYQLHKRVGIKLSVAELGRNSTIAALASYLEQERQHHVTELPLLALNLEQAPLSFAQQRLWYMENLHQDSSLYHVPYLIKLAAGVDLDKYQKSLIQVVERHQVLHSLIAQDQDGKAFQKVANLGLSVIHRSIESKDLQQQLQSDIHHPFDLSGEIPIRAYLYQSNDRGEFSYYSLLVVHHIAIDGWSMNVLMSELDHLYQGSAALPPLPLQYSDYAVWQQKCFDIGELTTAKTYWLDKLEGWQHLDLPIDLTRPHYFNYDGENYPVEITPELLRQLKSLARDCGVTLHAVLLTGFVLLLSRYSAQKDIVVGTPVANRNAQELAGLIGFFVNSLPLRNIVPDALAIEDFIHQVFTNTMEAQLHQNLPFEQLVDALGLPRDLSRHPLFQVMFTLEQRQTASDDQQWLQVMDISNVYRVAKFDLSLHIQENSRGASAIFNYALALFNPESIACLGRYFIDVLQQMVVKKGQAVSDINLMPDSEIQTLVAERENALPLYDFNRCLHDDLMAHALNKPEATAVIDAQGSLTYGELYQRALLLANQLQPLLTTQAKAVAVSLSKGRAQAVATLAILMAGKAFLPMDKSWPETRQKSIMAQSGTQVILSDWHFEQPDDLQVVAVDINGFAHDLPPVETLSAPISVTPDSLAYIIFTSGSTGVPKGVAIRHYGVMNTILDVNRRFKINANDRSIAMSALSFDLAVYDIFGVLAAGGAVVIPSDEQRYQPEEVYRLMIDHRVSIWFTAPALMELLLDYVVNNQKLDGPQPALRVAMVGGDWLSTTLPQRCRRWAPLCDFNSAGGATECSIISILYSVPQGELATATIPYGKAISHQRFYILDAQLRPVPSGVKGELYIAGEGLAAGYYLDPERTAQSFFFHPLLGERIYRTGDFGRYLHDGNIEFMGRIDQQVKINGYRIELGEIESTLLEISAIKSCYVMIHENEQQQRLVVYYVANKRSVVNKKQATHKNLLLRENTAIPEESVLDSAVLTQHMRERLPYYMVPAAWVEMEALPLNTSGKVDRTQLPEPVFDSHQVYVAPENAEQMQCTQIWQRILSSEQIGIEDNFFACGGTSLLAIQACHQIGKALETQVTVSELVQYPTISSLCDYLADKICAVPELPIVAHQWDEYPLSFSQMRLWFIENLTQGSSLYHVPMLCKLADDIDLDAYQTSLQQWVGRHQVLRSVINQKESQQATAKVSANGLQVVELELAKEDLAAQVQQDIDRLFDLKRDIPIRVLIYHCATPQGTCERYSLFVIHHIAFDGWSVQVMMRELAALYQYHSQRRDVQQGNDRAVSSQALQAPLAPLPIQYGDYACWQQQQLDTHKLDKLKKFWKEALIDWEHLDLPVDYARPQLFNHQGENQPIALTPELVHRLDTLAQSLEVSLHAVMLAGFNILLAYYSGQQDIIIGTPVANRPKAELENLIGFFVNSIPLRNQIPMDKTVAEFIHRVFQNTIACQQHQDLPFEYIVDSLNVPRDLSRHPLFQVMFTLEQGGNEDQALAWMTPVTLTDFYQSAKFDLSLNIHVKEECINAVFNYSSALFSSESMRYLSDYLITIYQQMADNCQSLVEQLQLLPQSEVEKQAKLRQLTPYQYPFERCVHDDFIANAKKNPDAIAIIDSLGECSYRELYQSALTLSNQLRQNKALTSEGIAVMVDKGRALLVAIMGILMSGKAYLPMDSSWPEMRRVSVMKQSGTQVVIASHAWESDEVDVVLINAQGQAKALPKIHTLLPPLSVAPENLAYIIFTSGSTGTPKGVAVKHRGAVNSIVDTNRQLGINAQDRAFAISAVSFDISAYDLFGILAVGGCLVMPSEAERYQPEHWYRLMMQHRVTFWNSAPAVLELLVDYVESAGLQDNTPALRSVVLVGDVIPTSLPVRCRRWAPHCRMTSMGGATESSIWSIMYDIPEGEIRSPSIPYGKPLTHQTFYILDAQQRVLPTCIKGEQYIGGEGVAREYFKDPERTAERFIYHPVLGERLYRTGDLGRYLPDGNMEFMGRVDHQVKLNGYRIELGEIENNIMLFPGIKACRVLVYQDETQKRLTAYYVDDGQTQEAELIQFLYPRLPHYMVPSAFIHMDALPLNSSGKLDRKALPAPQSPQERSYVAPENELEKSLCDLWQSVLNVEKVGMEDDFFALGGTSILAISVALKLSQLIGSTVPVATLFQHRTLRGILQSQASQYQLVQALNPTDPSSNNLWLIHPALVGSEVFYPFAESAKGKINCYGVDNYNLYHRPLLTNQQEVSQRYLSEMEAKGLLDGNKPVHILGWSLGGVIALHIAKTLELRGIENIHLYLLDSFYQIDVGAELDVEREDLLANLGIAGDAAFRALEITAAEDSIANERLLSPLKTTQVTLFKATEAHQRSLMEGAVMSEVLSIKDNGLSAACEHLQVVELACSHYNILDRAEEILDILLPKMH